MPMLTKDHLLLPSTFTIPSPPDPFTYSEMMLAESYTVIIKKNSDKVNAAMVIAIKRRHEPPQGDPPVRRTGGSFSYQSIGASNCVHYIVFIILFSVVITCIRRTRRWRCCCISLRCWCCPIPWRACCPDRDRTERVCCLRGCWRSYR